MILHRPPNSRRDRHLARLAAALIAALAWSASSAAAPAGKTGEKTGAKNGAKTPPAAPASIDLTLRYRVETSKGSGRYHVLTRKESWDPRRSAVIVCDMWDSHHCLNAVRRVKQLAPRMNRVIGEARRRGALIIHAPSGCMKTYDGHPARERARRAPRAANLPAEIGKWCSWIPAEERDRYPLDQSDGGEDDDPEEHRRWEEELRGRGVNPRHPWQSEIDVLEIRDEDAISDSGVEIWNLLEERGIENVILLGVHTNMCVLGRPFGLRQMARNGKHVVLMRDMTDTMYNPARWPYVSHFTGTDLIVEHIEKYVCPTVTSADLLGGEPFRFKGDDRPHVVFVIAEDEYRTRETLPVFALSQLGKSFRWTFVFGSDAERDDIPGIEAVENADVLFLSMRRRALPEEQLAVIRKHVAAGKPLVAIRTASHAFALRGGKKPAPGHAVWPEFDGEVLGGHYVGHHSNTAPPALVRVVPDAADHPILRGIRRDEFPMSGSLYKVLPLAATATPLLVGRIEGEDPPQPVAWTNERPGAGRVFYTSLGHPDCFASETFNRLLRNAILWAAGRPVPAVETASAKSADSAASTRSTEKAAR